MGGGGGQQQQVSQVQLPKWVEQASGQNYQFAQQVANQPYQAYQGQTVAGFSPDQLSAMDYSRNNVGAYQPVYDAGVTMANQSGMYQPDQVRAGQFTDANVGAYMNPYLDQVESNALRNIQGATQLAVNKIGDQAATSRAFGGSRQGISEGVTIAEGTKQAGDLSAKLRSDAYDRAMQQINADQNRTLQGDLANQSAGMQNANRQLTAAQTMSGIADQGRKSMSDDITRMLTLGQMQQGQEQRYLDDAQSRFNEARDYPKEQLNILLSALGMSPYGKTQVTEQSSPTGLDVYSYRYKGDPKSYPKVVGLMADDIEEKMPGATQEVAGKKAVKFNPAVPKNRIKKA